MDDTIAARPPRRLVLVGAVALLALLVPAFTTAPPVAAASWSTDSSGTSQNLWGVACVSSSFCKAVGDSGTIRSWNGSSWTADSSGTTQSLNAVACASTTFCKAVGNGGTILAWNGSSWSTDQSGTTQVIEGVACISTSFCKAVGADP